MAKIPVYNEGRGLTQHNQIVELSRSTKLGACTSPAKAVSKVEATAGQVAFNCGME